MVVMTGGRERTLKDWQDIAIAAEFTLQRTVPLSATVGLLELKPNER